MPVDPAKLAQQMGVPMSTLDILGQPGMKGGGKGGMQQGGYGGNAVPFKAPPSAPSSADEPPAKHMRVGDASNFGKAPGGLPPWKMGGAAPPPKLGFPGSSGPAQGNNDTWQSDVQVSSKSSSFLFKGGPPSKGPPGPAPKAFGQWPALPAAGGGGFLFGGGFGNMQVQLQNENERLREERVRVEEERMNLEMQMQQRKKIEEAQKKAAEVAEQLRIEQEEARKIQEEKIRQEEEKKKEEAEDKAALLHLELEELVATSELLVKNVMEKAAGNEKETDDDEVILTCEELETEIKDAKDSLKLCSDFLGLKHLGLVGALEETRMKALKFRSRTQDIGRNLEREVAKVAARKKKAVTNKEAEARRVAAVKAAEKQQATFTQYDVDGDDKLNAQEIMEYVKGEYDFEFPLEKAEVILKQDAFAGKGGVIYSKFPHLKMLIGIARNEVMARKRKIEKDLKEKHDKAEKERKRLLAIEQTAQVLKGIKLVEESMSGIEAEVVKAENMAKPMSIVRGRGALGCDQLQEKAEEVDTACEAARDFLAAAKDQASSMAGVPNDKLEPSVIPGCAPARQLFFRLEYFEKRLMLSQKSAHAARDRAFLAQKKAALMREASIAAHEAHAKLQMERQNAPINQQAGYAPAGQGIVVMPQQNVTAQLLQQQQAHFMQTNAMQAPAMPTQGMPDMTALATAPGVPLGAPPPLPQ